MDAPLLSVCLITYNHAPYIKDAIEGVLMQKVNFSWELIIADDFSTDVTREIVLEYKEKYPDFIKLILQEKNVGAAQNWRDLITSPKSKYIAYFEGDDYWTDPLKLKKQVDFLESHSDYCLVYSDYNILIDKKNKINFSVNKKRNKIIPKGDIFEDLLINNPIATLTVCARTDVLKKVVDFELFEKKGFLSGDLPLWLGMSLHGKIHYIDEPMATHRVLEESASHSKDPKKMMKIIISDYEQRFSFVKKYGCSEDTKRIVEYNYNKSLLKYAFLLRDRNLGEISYNNLLKYKNLKDKICIKQKLFYYGSRNVFNWSFVLFLRKLVSVFNSY